MLLAWPLALAAPALPTTSFRSTRTRLRRDSRDMSGKLRRRRAGSQSVCLRGLEGHVLYGAGLTGKHLFQGGILNGLGLRGLIMSNYCTGGDKNKGWPYSRR